MILRAQKRSSRPPPSKDKFVDCLKEHVPLVRTPSGPPLWVVVHVMVKCIEGLYDLWRVTGVYTVTHRNTIVWLPQNFPKLGEIHVGPRLGGFTGAWHILLFLRRSGETFFNYPPSPQNTNMGLTRYSYKRRLQNCFQGWSLVTRSLSVQHMHHCRSLTDREQGLLGLEAEKASNIHDFV